jgi:hypothetical protein
MDARQMDQRRIANDRAAFLKRFPELKNVKPW